MQNHNGFIDAEELKLGMGTVGLDLTIDQAKSLLIEMDDLCQGLVRQQDDDVDAMADKFEDDG
eukprot:SAG31_NODE_6966_length_1832_cov_1.414310_2_plen_63_part_00